MQAFIGGVLGGFTVIFGLLLLGYIADRWNKKKISRCLKGRRS